MSLQEAIAHAHLQARAAEEAAAVAKAAADAQKAAEARVAAAEKRHRRRERQEAMQMHARSLVQIGTSKFICDVEVDMRAQLCQSMPHPLLRRLQRAELKGLQRRQWR